MRSVDTTMSGRMQPAIMALVAMGCLAVSSEWPGPSGAWAQGTSECVADGCEVVLVRELTVSIDEVRGDFGNDLIPAARDLEGRVYFGTRNGFVVFDDQGRLVERVDTSPLGVLHIPTIAIVGKDDSVHMFDPFELVGTVFDEDFERHRTFRVPSHGARLILPDGSYLVAGQILTPSLVGFPLHVMSAEGTIVHSFGEELPQYRADIPHLTRRVVGLSSDDTIWAAAPGRYDLERWDPHSGTRIDRIEVQSSWFEESVRPMDDWTKKPVPTISGIWEDEAGLVWVLALDASSDDWRPAAKAREFAITPANRAARWDSVIEVVDPTTKRVVASKRFDTPMALHPQSRVLTSHQLSNNPEPDFVDVWTARLQTKGEEVR